MVYQFGETPTKKKPLSLNYYYSILVTNPKEGLSSGFSLLVIKDGLFLGQPHLFRQQYQYLLIIKQDKASGQQ